MYKYIELKMATIQYAYFFYIKPTVDNGLIMSKISRSHSNYNKLKNTYNNSFIEQSEILNYNESNYNSIISITDSDLSDLNDLKINSTNVNMINLISDTITTFYFKCNNVINTGLLNGNNIATLIKNGKIINNDQFFFKKEMKIYEKFYEAIIYSNGKIMIMYNGLIEYELNDNVYYLYNLCQDNIDSLMTNAYNYSYVAEKNKINDLSLAHKLCGQIINNIGYNETFVNDIKFKLVGCYFQKNDYYNFGIINLSNSTINNSIINNNTNKLFIALYDGNQSFDIIKTDQSGFKYGDNYVKLLNPYIYMCKNQSNINSISYINPSDYEYLTEDINQNIVRPLTFGEYTELWGMNINFQEKFK